MQTAPSSTATTSQPRVATISYGTAPTVRTAAPSTNGSIDSSRTGPPAASAADIDGAPAGSTPTTRTSGARSAR